MRRGQKKAAQIALADQRRAGVGQAVRVARGRWPVMPKHARIVSVGRQMPSMAIPEGDTVPETRNDLINRLEVLLRQQVEESTLFTVKWELM
jgi:hypothetical protein